MVHLRVNILTRPAGFPPADRRLSAGCLTALAAAAGVGAGLNGPQPVARGLVELKVGSRTGLGRVSGRA